MKKNKNIKEQNIKPDRGIPDKGNPGPGTVKIDNVENEYVFPNIDHPKEFTGMIQWDWEQINNACFQVVQVISYDEGGNPNDRQVCDCLDPVITESLANKTLINQRNFIVENVRKTMSERKYKK